MGVTRKKFVAVVLLLISLLIALVFLIRFRGSVIIRPNEDHTTAETVFFLQGDPVWGKDDLGNSSYTMAHAGCLTTCITAAMQMQQIRIPSTNKLNPGILNRYFSDQSVYDNEGNIKWDAAEQALCITIIRQQLDGSTAEEIEELLDNEIYPIVRVRVKGIGNFHFVLITGSRDGEFTCMDPLNGEKKGVLLSQYGNRIYAIRYLSE